MDRLKRFKEEFGFRERKYELNKIGERLFAMPESKYPVLTKTKKELQLLTQLYDLYSQVIATSEEWDEILWVDVVKKMEEMKKKAVHKPKKIEKSIVAFDVKVHD